MSESAEKSFGVLFLCTGNSARSLLAEAALVRRGGDRFRSYSAGSHPTGTPHPRSLETLERLGYDDGLIKSLRSKRWDEFAAPDAPRLDLVVTVCDNAAGETCPIWPGAPLTAHWGVEDPAAFDGPEDEALACFERIHDELAAKIDGLVALWPELAGGETVAERIRALCEVRAD